MQLKLTKLAMLIDAYGLLAGIKLYVKLKYKWVNAIRVKGIAKPILLRKNTSDIAIFNQIFILNEYNIPLQISPKVVVDAGANIGLFAVYFANKYPQSFIFCIEPVEENFKVLQQNTRHYHNIKNTQAGLWHTNTSLHVVDKFKMGFSAMAVEENNQTGAIQAIDMETFMKINSITHIDVLKIDIEGSEQNLFLTNYHLWLPKVKLIIIELHDWLQPNNAQPFFKAIDATFKNYKYTIVGENTVIENLDFNK